MIILTESDKDVTVDVVQSRNGAWWLHFNDSADGAFITVQLDVESTDRLPHARRAAAALLREAADQIEGGGDD